MLPFFHAVSWRSICGHRAGESCHCAVLSLFMLWRSRVWRVAAKCHFRADGVW